MDPVIYLTDTERRLFDLLADGAPHKLPEVLTSLGWEEQDRATLYVHISSLRRKLMCVGEDLVAQSFGKASAYRRVRMLGQSPVQAKPYPRFSRATGT